MQAIIGHIFLIIMQEYSFSWGWLSTKNGFSLRGLESLANFISLVVLEVLFLLVLKVLNPRVWWVVLVVGIL